MRYESPALKTVSESTPDIEVLAHGIEEGIDELLALVRGTAHHDATNT